MAIKSHGYPSWLFHSKLITVSLKTALWLQQSVRIFWNVLKTFNQCDQSRQSIVEVNADRHLDITNCSCGVWLSGDNHLDLYCLLSMTCMSLTMDGTVDVMYLRLVLNHIVIRHAISSTYYLLGYYGDLIHLSHSHFHCRSGLTVSQQGRRPLPFCPCPLARPHTELLWQFYLFWVRIQNLADVIWKDRWKLICVCYNGNPEVPLWHGIKHFHSPVKVSPPNSPKR